MTKATLVPLVEDGRVVGAAGYDTGIRIIHWGAGEAFSG